MAKNRWKRDPLTGLTRKQLEDLPGRYVTRDGLFNCAALPDCNLYDVRTIAAEANYDARYFRDVVLTHSGSPFHVHKISAENADGSKGRILVYATHTDSAHAGREQFRAATMARQTGYEPPPMTLPVKWSS